MPVGLHSMSKINVDVHRTHMPALDGVRGIAISLVFIFHAVRFFPPPGGPISRFAFGAMQQGWVGVDLFFVLSGFLITSTLIATKRDAYYFRKFYVRRALRIFPLYYAFLAVVAFAFLLSPSFSDAHRDLRDAQPFFWLYMAGPSA
jgi:peptidoglycan/LPS O-acetylase OafA/YrhL